MVAPKRYKSEMLSSSPVTLSKMRLISKSRNATVESNGTHFGGTVKSSGVVRASSVPFRTGTGPIKAKKAAVKMLKKILEILSSTAIEPTPVGCKIYRTHSQEKKFLRTASWVLEAIVGDLEVINLEAVLEDDQRSRSETEEIL
ncbi:unnamed protein product [Ilex paraguariensis]|uniref:Uncharacterized protein n=1 Tax=Ilex paraguariensis TaxID=185542 RepID=A0ABC8U798_9AQUA